LDLGGDAAAGDWRKLHNAELHGFYCSPYITLKIQVFWDVTPCPWVSAAEFGAFIVRMKQYKSLLYPENGGTKVSLNGGNDLPSDTSSHSRRLNLSHIIRFTKLMNVRWTVYLVRMGDKRSA
jgi:hypothetical protein